MKKFFTLLAAAAVAVPMMTAVEKTVTAELCYKFDNSNYTKIAELANQKITYDETENAYTLVNFIGWQGADFKFTINYDKTYTLNAGTDNKQVVNPIMITFASANRTEALANGDKIVQDEVTNYSKKERNFTVNSSEQSAVFTGVVAESDGVTYDYRYDAGTYFGILTANSIKYASAANCLSYAVVDGDNIELYIGGIMKGSYMNLPKVVTGSTDWTSAAKLYGMYSAVKYNFPAELKAGVEGIEIDNNDAPVEYFNLQGIKVENPAAGLYIKRQGDKVEKVVIR